ncbi:MAG: methyltransferase domain-containing protein [Bryobacteraceae bacterium]
MFGEYLYVSSASRTLLDHFEALADTVVRREELAKGEAVMDIGSNDGSLLAAFARRGMRVLGIDPARNLAALARERGVETETVFFGAATAARIRSARGPARVLTATNSLPHIPALDDYFAGVRTLLAPDGVFVAEAHYLADVDGQSAFDTIYHEHVSYWVTEAVDAAARRALARGISRRAAPVHHGQLRVWVAHRGARTTEASVRDVLAEERRLRLHDIATWRAFARRAQAVREGLRGASRAEAPRTAHRRVRRRLQGDDAAGVARARSGMDRVHCRPESVEAGALHARHTYSDCRAGADRRRST